MQHTENTKDRIWLASSSLERLLWLAASLAKLGVSSEVLLRAVASPVEEPSDLEAFDITLYYKVLPLAVAMGLVAVTDELVRELPWVQGIKQFDQPVNSQEIAHTIIASDARTLLYLLPPKKLKKVTPEALLAMDGFKWIELLKLERKTDDKQNADPRTQVVLRDKTEHEQLYLSGKGIAVRFSLAIVVWDAESGYRTEQCEIIAKLKPGIITQKDIDLAYSDGTAWKSGARLDLAQMIAERELAEVVYIRTGSGWRELTESEIAEIVPAWVKGGVADLETMRRLLQVDGNAAMPQVINLDVDELESAHVKEYSSHINIRTYSFGANTKTFLQLPATIIGTENDITEVSPTIIEIMKEGTNTYSIGQDGLLLLQYHLSAIGLPRSKMVAQSKAILKKFKISVFK